MTLLCETNKRCYPARFRMSTRVACGIPQWCFAGGLTSNNSETTSMSVLLQHCETKSSGMLRLRCENRDAWDARRWRPCATTTKIMTWSTSSDASGLRCQTSQLRKCFDHLYTL
eukprot:2908762-Amphidinium_carterae.1